MNFSVTGMVQQVLPAMGLKKWSGGAFLFLKRVSNDKYIYIYIYIYIYMLNVFGKTWIK